MNATARQTLEGWGRYPRVESDVLRLESRRDLIKAVTSNGNHSVLARGLGRAYGDAALLDGGVTLLMERLDRILEFDPETGWLRCEAGFSLDDLVRIFLPRGFFPPVVPGTRFVTLGGALASDVHGKNHHVSGSWASHIRNVELLKSNGEVVFCDAERNSELFWTTAGGQGLTGIILSMEVRLHCVKSDAMVVESTRVRDLEEFLDVSAAHQDWPYSVSWIDGLARGKSLGRGSFMAGRHAPAGSSGKAGLLSKLPRALVSGRFLESNLLLNGLSARMFNAAFYRKQITKRSKGTLSVYPFFFPLDAVDRWNRMYGKRGFFQYQFVVPPDPQHFALKQILTTISESGTLPFLGVIKEFGNESHGGLSFPRPGVTVALDFANTGQNALDLFTRLDDMVADAGGRVYLSKDARLSPEAFRRMYPEWEEWKRVRDEADPLNMFQSELGRRLGLVGEMPA
jgi:decaprenylphospho-beta-D-ribofuranose 2-oxidase